jgi:hypothetical protein
LGKIYKLPVAGRNFLTLSRYWKGNKGGIIMVIQHNNSVVMPFDMTTEKDLFFVIKEDTRYMVYRVEFQKKLEVHFFDNGEVYFRLGGFLFQKEDMGVYVFFSSKAAHERISSLKKGAA